VVSFKNGLGPMPKVGDYYNLFNNRALKNGTVYDIKDLY
jgi:hypothetical protein